MDDIIILDDELHPSTQVQQQQLIAPGNPGSPSSSSSISNKDGPIRCSRRAKRNHNGAKILPSAEMLPQMVTSLPSVPSKVIASTRGSSVIINGQDIYYIQEVQDSNDQIVLVPDAEPSVQYLQPSYTVSEYDVGYESTETQDVEQQLDETADFNTVEPMELSDIWNDLITANPEVLILLELSDLKHHIFDARKIEEQMRDMACEYCGRVFPDIHLWDRHVRKIHFQTDLFECDSCDGKFKYFARYKDHLNGHTGQRVYQCDECNYQYAFRMGFLVHKILDHMKLNGIYVCPKCDLDLRDALNYKLHMASHIEFDPGSQNTSNPVAPPVASTAAVAKSTSNSVRKINQVEALAAANNPFYTKENERNKFLNVFESFSKNRKLEGLENKRKNTKY